MVTRQIDIINVPSDIGSIYSGKSKAPAAFAAAGLQQKLRDSGFEVSEYDAFPSSSSSASSLSTTAVGGWRSSAKSPNGARNEAETVHACYLVKDRVTEALRTSKKYHGKSSFQFILSGECLYTPAILSAYWHQLNASSHPVSEEKTIGIIYIDADTDLFTPVEPNATGTIAGMTQIGRAHV